MTSYSAKKCWLFFYTPNDIYPDMRKLYFLLFALVASGNLFSQNYTILGNASQLPLCNCYQLTPNQGDQAGAIFQNNTINLNNSFSFTFRNFFGCNGASGADGEAFVLTTNPNGLGNQGEGLGYGGSNQPCSFAIEFDTWQNTDHGRFRLLPVKVIWMIANGMSLPYPGMPIPKQCRTTWMECYELAR